MGLIVAWIVLALGLSVIVSTVVASRGSTSDKEELERS